MKGTLIDIESAYHRGIRVLLHRAQIAVSCSPCKAPAIMESLLSYFRLRPLGLRISATPEQIKYLLQAERLFSGQVKKKRAYKRLQNMYTTKRENTSIHRNEATTRSLSAPFRQKHELRRSFLPPHSRSEKKGDHKHTHLHCRVAATLSPMAPAPAYSSVTLLPFLTALWSFMSSRSNI